MTDECTSTKQDQRPNSGTDRMQLYLSFQAETVLAAVASSNSFSAFAIAIACQPTAQSRVCPTFALQKALVAGEGFEPPTKRL